MRWMKKQCQVGERVRGKQESGVKKQERGKILLSWKCCEQGRMLQEVVRKVKWVARVLQ